MSTPTLPSPGPACGARLPSRTSKATQIVQNVYHGAGVGNRARALLAAQLQILDHLADVLDGQLLLSRFNILYEVTVQLDTLWNSRIRILEAGDDLEIFSIFLSWATTRGFEGWGTGARCERAMPSDR